MNLSAARHRLVLLYVLATGPLLLLLALGAWVDRNQALRAAGHQAENIARIGSMQQANMINEAETILELLARLPEVRHSRSECNDILRRLEEKNTRFSNFTLAGADTLISCSSNAARVNHVLSDTAFHNRVLAGSPGTVRTSSVIFGKATGKPTMVVARPLRGGPDNVAVAAISASLDLAWFQQLSRRLSGTAATLVEIIDAESGVVTARSNGDQVVIGGEQAAAAVLATIRDKPGGGSFRAMAHGAMHTVGFAALPGSEGNLFITTALPESVVLASSNYHLTLNAIGFLGAAIAALTLAWLAAERSLLSPIRQLVATAAAIGRGELLARIGPLPRAVEELRTLGAEFDEMAERLRLRDEKIAAMGERIAQSEEHHRLMADNAGDMLARFDHNFTRTYVSPACRDIIGFEQKDMLSAAMVDVVVEEDRSRVRSQLIRPLLSGAETARCTYRAKHKLGGHVWIETFGRRLADGTGFVTVARDVSTQKELEAQLETANQQLRIQVMQDPLTGIANRRRFDETLGFEFRRAQRVQEPLSLLMVDIDHFKSFNDTLGHVAGDECLRAVATTLAQVLQRPGDLVGRYGGEEFAIVLPSTPLSGAVQIAERMRLAVLSIQLPDPVPTSRKLSVSIGTATTMVSGGETGPAALIEAADAALYEAKRAGRNCVRLGTAMTALMHDDLQTMLT